jgi:hypothetical protein
MTELISDLWNDFLAPGKVQLLVQSDRSTKTRRIHGLDASDVVDYCPTYQAVCSSTAPVAMVPHPLDPADYVDLVQGADVGLFLYDSRAYYARCSGILLEMLSAGVPSIVPAGCWLADQMYEPWQRHLRALERQAVTVRRAVSAWLPLGARPGSRHAAPTEITFGGAERACAAQVEVPAEARELWVSFRTAVAEQGMWVRVDCEQDGGPRSGQSSIVRAEPLPKSTRVMFRIAAAGGPPRLRFYNAYHDSPIKLRDLEVGWIASGGAGRGVRALGAAGLIASDRRQIPALLDEMLTRYEHYSATAGAFSKVVTARHHPRNAVNTLFAGARHATPGRPRRNVA